jgi:hypothetical protein
MAAREISVKKYVVRLSGDISVRIGRNPASARVQKLVEERAAACDSFG